MPHGSLLQFQIQATKCCNLSSIDDRGTAGTESMRKYRRTTRRPQSLPDALRVAALAIAVLIPTGLRAQAAGQDALAIFPADTQQMAYTDLSQMREIPQYATIRTYLLSPQIRSLEDFLRPAGINAEKDVNEIVLGWRGEVKDTTDFFGIAEGQFDTEKVHEYFINNKLPYSLYKGYNLYAFGSGGASTDLFFTFIGPAEAAFGRLSDLKAVLDVQNGEKSSLGSSDNFRRWEGDLEGTAPQWGIATGRAAANEAIPWLTQGKKLQINADALFSPIKAVLYRANWSDGLEAHLTVICQNSQSAEGLAQLFNLLRSAGPKQQGAIPPGVSKILQNLQVQTDGARLDLVATSSISNLTNLLNNASEPAPATH